MNKYLIIVIVAILAISDQIMLYKRARKELKKKRNG